MGGLELNFSMDVSRDDVGLGRTYRDEGLTVGFDYIRLFGEQIQMEVQLPDLVMGQKIGQGACSSVHLARHRRQNELYAVKLFNILDRAQASQLYNEIVLLLTMSCDALVCIKGGFHQGGCIGVILECMDRGSLDRLLTQPLDMDERTFAAIAFQIIWALAFLHFERQIHRDIKPANILMNSLGQVKVSDFGISKDLGATTAMSQSSVGTYRYMSLERLMGERYDSSADVWSAGVTLLELWNRQYPFARVDTPVHLVTALSDLNTSNLLRNGRDGRPPSMEFRQVIDNMLREDASQRASCEKLVNHPWFAMHGIDSLESAAALVKAWQHNQDHRHPNAIPFVKMSSIIPTSYPNSANNGGGLNMSMGGSLPSRISLEASQKIMTDVLEESAGFRGGLHDSFRGASRNYHYPPRNMECSNDTNPFMSMSLSASEDMKSVGYSQRDSKDAYYRNTYPHDQYDSDEGKYDNEPFEDEDCK